MIIPIVIPDFIYVVIDPSNGMPMSSTSGPDAWDVCQETINEAIMDGFDGAENWVVRVYDHRNPGEPVVTEHKLT